MEISIETIEIPAKEIILKRLEALPQLIYDQESNILKTQDIISEQDFRAKLIKNQIMLDISKEQDAEGKPLHKNELQRDSELAKRLSLDEQYRGIMEKMDKNTGIMKEQQIHLSFLERRFSAAKAMIKTRED